MADGNKLERINGWLTLGANIGVVFGLVIVIVELNQNAALTRLSIEASKNELLAEIELNLADPATAEIWVKSYTAPEQLTDAEMRIVESYLISMMLQWDYMLQMEKAGLAPRKDVENHIRNSAPFYFGSRFAKNWFRAETAGWENTAMFAVAGPVVEAIDDDFLLKRMEALRLSVSDAKPAE